MAKIVSLRVVDDFTVQSKLSKSSKNPATKILEDNIELNQRQTRCF